VKFRWNHEAQEVFLAGTFLENWKKKIQMEKVDKEFRCVLVNKRNKLIKEIRKRTALLQIYC
jgi:hypothetical protein